MFQHVGIGGFQLIGIFTYRQKGLCSSISSKSLYVIYKPWLGGVYAEYTTRGRGQRKFAAEINPERSEGFIEAANFR